MENKVASIGKQPSPNKNFKLEMCVHYSKLCTTVYGALIEKRLKRIDEKMGKNIF